MRAALALVDERTPSGLVARLEHAEAEVARKAGEFSVSLAAAERALVWYDRLGDVLGSAKAQSVAGIELTILGRAAEAEPLLQEALKTARTLGDRRLAATVLRRLGNARGTVRDFAGARAYLTEALGLANVLGAELLAADVALALADTEYDAGGAQTALRLTLDVLATLRTLNSSSAASRVSTTVGCLAIYLFALGRYDEARVYANEALEVGRGLGMAALVANSLQHLALMALLRPRAEVRCTPAEYASVARLLGFVDARFATLEIPKAFWMSQEHNRALAILRDAIGADELTRQMAIGATMTEDEAIEQAHALE